MLTSNQTTLCGDLIELIQLHEVHREYLRALSQDNHISQFSPALRFKFDYWFDKALNHTAQQLAFVVYHKKDNKIVGSTRYYEIQPNHKRLAIGYTWYSRDVWGTGVNTECKLLLLQHAFNTLEMNRVEFFIDSRNLRSCAAVKKLGAIQEGVLRQHIILDDGYCRDTIVFSILKSEWPSIEIKLRKAITGPHS